MVNGSRVGKTYRHGLHDNGVNHGNGIDVESDSSASVADSEATDATLVCTLEGGHKVAVADIINLARDGSLGTLEIVLVHKSEDLLAEKPGGVTEVVVTLHAANSVVVEGDWVGKVILDEEENSSHGGIDGGRVSLGSIEIAGNVAELERIGDIWSGWSIEVVEIGVVFLDVATCREGWNILRVTWK